MAQGSPVEEQ
jgi:hypothetical protein